jgi:hypothetical protein
MYPILPGQSFTIVRQLGLPGDTATYYVQAVVKNSVTGAVIATVNLSGNSAQRYTGTFQAPADKTGLGTNIDITTSVYTDSGYTTPSQLYSIENTTYVVRDTSRWGNGGGGLGGGSTSYSPDVDYEKIRKMILEAVASIVFPVFPEMPEHKETDLSGVMSKIESLESAIQGKDLSPIHEKVSALHTFVQEKLEQIVETIHSKPEFKETDLSPILDAVEDYFEDHKEMLKGSVSSLREDLMSKLEDLDNLDTSLEELLTKTQEHLKRKRVRLSETKEAQAEPEKDIFEIIRSIYPKKK